MARPTARVLSLLELLQAGGTHTATELSSQLHVDERTVRRYVEHLNDLDIPVESVRGRYGGYRLARHFRMPPLMLTDEEAVAVVWGLLTTARSTAGPSSSLHVQTALAKVRRVLPSPLARRVEAVVEVVDFTADRPDQDEPDEGAARPGVLLDLAQAARDRRPVSFGYAPRHGRPSWRSVHPHNVVAHRRLLYLTGLDIERQEIRTFRLDRITDLRLLDGTFQSPKDLDTAQGLLGPLAPAPGRHDVTFRIRADTGHVRRFIPETLASVTPIGGDAQEGGWLRVFLRAERLEWVAGRLAVLDRPFVIETPETLRDVVATLGHQLIAASCRT
jgi:predicted DNA-binding transcriptional regulator YafY